HGDLGLVRHGEGGASAADRDDADGRGAVDPRGLLHWSTCFLPRARGVSVSFPELRTPRGGVCSSGTRAPPRGGAAGEVARELPGAMVSRFAPSRKGCGETLRKHPRGLYPLVNFAVGQVTPLHLSSSSAASHATPPPPVGGRCRRRAAGG